MGAFSSDTMRLQQLLQTLHRLEEQVALSLTETGEPRGHGAEIKFRERRSAMFPHGYFTDPAWDILLDLYSAHCAGRPISTTGLGLAAGVPQTTMLRHLGQLVNDRLAVRVNDPLDRRRVYVELTETGIQRMASLFETQRKTEPAAIYGYADQLNAFIQSSTGEIN